MDFGQPLRHIKTVCVANRGEIAVRCIKACRELGVKSVAIFTHADATSLHVALADEPVLLPGSDSTAYTDGDAILDICKKHGVDAIIPGYGFLSENTDFAAAAEKAGIAFVGPTAASIERMGLKHEARELAVAADVPVIPGTGLLASAAEAVAQAEALGFPVMLKATGGGGGMGLQICHSSAQVHEAFAVVESRAGALFKNSGMFMERYFPRARHIEVQVAGNGDVVVAFGERECSIQRRHQKVVEECPSPFVARTPGLREKIVGAAVRFASQLHYKSVGTVEFLVDDETAAFFFLEMNTRLQVEHGITELCYDVDLVHLMLHQADHERGGQPGIPSDQLAAFGAARREPRGAAIEVRVYAEVPLRDFAPSPGVLQRVVWPHGDGVRVDTWVRTGQTLTSYYDPLIGKVMVHAADGRPAARQKMLAALDDTVLQGTQNNLAYLQAVLGSADFDTGNTLTSMLASFTFETCAIQVLNPGVFTTVQDYPGRTATGFGIPRSGPMDDVSSRVANILVGNAPGVEVLEITLSGPELLFHAPGVVAVCGVNMPVSVDGVAAGMWSRIVVQKGQRLQIGHASGTGFRAYLAIKGGFPQVPAYLGSKSTTPELAIGGVQGRKLQMHDMLALDPKTAEWAAATTPFSLPATAVPDLTFHQVHCLDGPFGSDDMVTPAGRDAIYSTTWKVNHNSGRSGVRMTGPAIEWARASGGGGGSHPSNVFDYGYPMSGINWTGDSPVIFACDSPDLGGFACPTTICTGDQWKLGQLKPGDEVRLSPTTLEGALQIVQQQDVYLAAIAQLAQGESLAAVPPMHTALPAENCPAILHQVAWDTRPDVKYRRGGDTSIIVEYGHQVADLRNTACVQILTRELEARKLEGVRLAPAIFSVTLYYDFRRISQAALMAILLDIDQHMADVRSARMPVRELRLPVCLDHPAVQEATERYMHNIRDKAVYLPDNVEYLRRNNALAARQDVFDALLNTRWLTVSVGFYVGTPVMFPLDPKYVYVGQKYNPSRIFTPAGAIGIGGSMLAIYPVAAPGGYQLTARTLGLWDAAGNRPGFSPAKPWLFNCFDLVTFQRVSEAEYDAAERAFACGRYTFDIVDTVLDMEHYMAVFEAADKDPAHREWRARQDAAASEVAALEAEMAEQWAAEKAASSSGGNATDFLAMPNAVAIESPIDASVWKVEVSEGDVLVAGQTIAILEAMKMEIKVQCSDEHVGAVVKSIVSPPGTVVSPGTLLVAAVKEKEEKEA